MIKKCLFVGKKLVTIKHFIFNSFGGSKFVTKWQFLPMFNRHQFFYTNTQYLNIKLIQNEKNLWSNFLVKTKYCKTLI